MLLGEEGLDLDQQLLLDHIWHKLPTLGSDCSHLFDVIQVTDWLTFVRHYKNGSYQLLLGDILKALLFNHLE